MVQWWLGVVALLVAKLADAADNSPLDDVIQQSIQTSGRSSIAPVNFIARFGPSATDEDMHIFAAPSIQHTGTSKTILPHLRLGVISLPHGSSVEDARAELNVALGMTGVEEILPDTVVQIIEPQDQFPVSEENPGEKVQWSGPVSPHPPGTEYLSPSDPFFGFQWGTSVINAPWAWHIATGKEPHLYKPIVVVIDTGLDWTHPDITESAYVNFAELHGIPGVDDDGNGYIDDIYGWNAITDTGDSMDDHGHGTHVSGTLGATGDNLIGISGVHWQPRIAGCKFLGADGSGSTSGAIKCFEYAISIGADITNNSWGGGPYSAALKVAIDVAGQLFGQTAVCAAGNDGNNSDFVPKYPAAYDSDYIISVAAMNYTGEIARWSNYGVESVDIAAPGVWIASTLPGDNYAIWSGTSMAAPHVAGGLALMKAVAPSMTPFIAKTILASTTLPFTNSASLTKWNGYLDLFGAILEAISIKDHLILAPATMTCEAGCKQAKMGCNNRKTTEMNVNLMACYHALENSGIPGNFVLGDYQYVIGGPLVPPLAPTGCFQLYRASTYQVHINYDSFGSGQYGCKAPPAGLSATTRACYCTDLKYAEPPPLPSLPFGGSEGGDAENKASPSSDGSTGSPVPPSPPAGVPKADSLGIDVLGSIM